VGFLSKVVTGTTVVALALAGGYVWADVTDRVPGVLTNAPKIPDPLPFPTVEVVDPTTTISTPDAEVEGLLPQSARITELINNLVKDKERVGERVAVMVSDVETGTALGSSLATTPVVPASVQKLLTAVVAMDQLDHERTFKTRIIKTSSNELYLAGEGDMMLSSGAGSPDSVNGRAGLADLADAIAEKLELEGTTSVSLYLDDSAFSGDKLGPWDPKIPADGYGAPISTVAINVGRSKNEEYAPRFEDPEFNVVKVLARLLKERGIDVTRTSRKVFDSAGAAMKVPDQEVFAQIESASLEEVVGYLLKTSDNSITEVVGRTIARERGIPGSFAGSTTAVLQGLKDMGFDVTDVTLADCSGLGETSHVTAQLISQVLNAMVDPGQPKLRTVAVNMPVAHLDGTLSARYETLNGRGVVRAKTGSLIGVTALAGTALTLDNRLLTFVVIADKTQPGGQWTARKTIDGFVEKLVECGCS